MSNDVSETAAGAADPDEVGVTVAPLVTVTGCDDSLCIDELCVTPAPAEEATG